MPQLSRGPFPSSMLVFAENICFRVLSVYEFSGVQVKGSKGFQYFQCLLKGLRFHWGFTGAR